MKNVKNLLFYIITIGIFSLLMYFIVLQGEVLQTPEVTNASRSALSTFEQFKDTYHHNITHPLAILLMQIITIIIAARVFGFFCKKIGQPTVIGEIAAGIFLGPSFIGMYFPEFSEFIFPAKSLSNLQFLSQIGLILFMFVVGMELDLKVLKNKAHESLVVSHASIIIPFSLGMGLAYFIYQGFAPAGVDFLSFSLFIGISLSITAFPVLARIVQERGLSKTKIGNIVITCAAADDITAWCILAAVIAIVKAGSFVSALYTMGFAVGYVLAMIFLVRPFLTKFGEKYSSKESLSKPIVAIFFITLLVSAYTAEIIGIHALFGAFLAGLIMPPNMNFRNIFIDKIEDVALVLLLPLFFVFTGLRTQIGLLNDPYLWKICAIIILLATVGKFVGSALSAKFVGQTWRESIMIGALMNTRGLMELVVLNIGYDLGVLTPEIFAMMVIMALVTTFMTGPALDFVNRFMKEPKEVVVPKEIQEERKYRLLIPFGNSKKGAKMVRLAHSLIKNSPKNAAITALHLSPGNEINQFNTAEYENASLSAVKREAKRLDISITTLFKPTQDVERELINVANSGNYDLTIIGTGQSVFQGSILGKVLDVTHKIINPEKLYETITGKEKLFQTDLFDETTKQILKGIKVPVGVFVDRDFQHAENVFIPILSVKDSFLFVYAQKLITNNESRIVILDVTGAIKQNPEMREAIRLIEQTAPNHIALYAQNKLDDAIMMEQDLMLTSLESWQKALEMRADWLAEAPSVLIIKA
jgi:Kef-type K+ transport system membrane component KefB